MSGTTKAANYQIGFPQGPMSVNGTMTAEWQRFFLWMFNRTGSSQGIDGAYVAGQSSQNASDIAALTLLAKEALQDAQLALIDAIAIRAEARKALETAEDLAIIRATTCTARDGSFLNESMILPTMI